MLIDMEGNIIAHSSYSQGNGATDDFDVRQFGIHGMLEMETLAAIERNKVYGTVFGEGGLPQEISAFYRLSDVPWYLVVIAPGETVLQPILTFRLYYSLLFAFAIFSIILFIRSMTSTMTGAIKKVSKAAENLANGVFGPPLPVQSGDEIGELTNSFNKMTAQIRQGVKLQKAMEIAREVQQNFLPTSRYVAAGIEICGSSRYSQETGGDFFDLVHFRDAPQKIGAVVGDVVGHGIGAALLMASVRAMIRSRNDQAGELAEIISDVNRVLCRDTQETSNFVTLFYAVVDPSSRTLEWVRAGHDPALLLYPDRHECLELYGKGVALGVDDSLKYESNTLEMSAEKQLIVIGSDGAWEAQNARGEMFGKEHLKKILLENCDEDIQKLIDLINKEIDIFLEGTQPQDDITFVVIKIDGCESGRS
jgi:sigma-B regulation protein RsbU (phosphoserine phosphatase)